MTQRVLYQNIRPYFLPSGLAALHGPAGGPLDLPVTVYWGPNPVADLDTPAGVTKAYQAIIRDGHRTDQETLLNRATLIRVWNDLLLPTRVRQQWESAFPELAR